MSVPQGRDPHDIARRLRDVAVELQGAVGLDGERLERLDWWELALIANEIGEALEQITFPLEDIGEALGQRREYWEPDQLDGTTPVDHAVRVQLERGARTVARAAEVTGGAAGMAILPALISLGEDLTVRLAVGERRWVDVALSGWTDPVVYTVRDARLGDPPLHERPKTATSAADLPRAIAAVCGCDEGQASALAREALERLAAMRADREQAARHEPSDRLPAERQDAQDRRGSSPTWVDPALVAVLADSAERAGLGDHGPFGEQLAIALARVVDAHPDGQAGVVAGVGEDTQVASALLELVRRGRRTSQQPFSTDDESLRAWARDNLLEHAALRARQAAEFEAAQQPPGPDAAELQQIADRLHEIRG